MLLDGVHHLALLTTDTDRLHRFYSEVFESKVVVDQRPEPGMRFSVVELGSSGFLTVFEIDGNDEARSDRPMFGRGRIDHVGVHAASEEAFDEIRRRLIDRGATDGFVTDFGPVLSVWFEDPDGVGGEVCLRVPEVDLSVSNPPGTPAAKYHGTVVAGAS